MFIPQGAACAHHPNSLASATCERCGNFACDDCLADGDRVDPLCLSCEETLLGVEGAKLSGRARNLKIALTLAGVGVLASIAWPARTDGGEKPADFSDLVTLWWLVAFVWSVVAWCRWQAQANRVLSSRKFTLAFGPRAWGWFVVPFANLWKPYQAVRELYWVATGEQYTPDVYWVWWGLWTAGNLLDRVEESRRMAAADPITKFWVHAVASVLLAGAAVAAFRLVSLVTRVVLRPRLSQRAALAAWRGRAAA